MKEAFLVMILAAASLAAAQMGTPPKTTPVTSGQAPAAQTPAGRPGAQTPAGQPGAQTPAGQPGAQTPAGQPPAAQTPAQGGRSMPQAKSQEEFKAYQDGAAKATPAETEAAADAFAAKYPDSELRTLLYRKAMYDYQNANNAEKTAALAKKMLAIDPNNPEALVTFATVTAQSTRETDLDRDERLNEAVQDASKALQTVDTDLIIPANASPDRVQAYKNSMRAMAYDALGTVAMVKKDYATAETNLRKSTELNSAQPDPVTWLRLSVALDQQKKYQPALDAANKAVQYSADAPQANNLAKMERDRLQKLVSAGPAATPATSPAPTSPAPTSPSPTPVAPPASKPPQK